MASPLRFGSGNQIGSPLPTFRTTTSGLDLMTEPSLREHDHSPHPLRWVEARCLAKAEAIRWAVERLRRLLEGYDAPIEDSPTDPELLTWANRLIDCYYWLNARDDAPPANTRLLDNLAGCYQALAEASSLAATTERQRGRFENALILLTEAQSALRRALQLLQASEDADQLEVFEWVRITSARHRIFLKRFMRADDPADPSLWPDILARIEALAGNDPHSRELQLRIDALRQDLKSLTDHGGTDTDWRAIMNAVEALVAQGLPPSNRELRTLLLPIFDLIPELDDPPSNFRLVLREIDRVLATRTPSAPSATASQATTPEVLEASRLLADRSPRAPVHPTLRAHHRPPRCPARLAGDPLVEPRLRRRRAALRPPRQAPRPPSRRLQPQSGRLPDPLPVQQAARRSLMPPLPVCLPRTLEIPSRLPLNPCDHVWPQVA